MGNNGIPAPVYAALAALMMALTAVIQEWLRAKREKQATEKVTAKVTAKANEVKETVQFKSEAAEHKLNEIATMGERNHVLLNSNFLAQLKVSAIALRRIAILTKDQEDISAADLAEKLLQEQEAKQQRLNGEDIK